MNNQIEEILLDLKPKMKPERYHHTIGVMYTAANLAYAYDYDANKALLAGALHDCAKLVGVNDYIDECRHFHIPVPEYCFSSPHLLHADLGAYYAKNRYHVEDEEILHAILVHTTGCKNMSLLDKILYLADYIEPGRTPYSGIEKLRKAAYKDRDYAVFLEAANVLECLKERNFAQDPRTRETYEYYAEILNRR